MSLTNYALGERARTWLGDLGLRPELRPESPGLYQVYDSVSGCPIGKSGPEFDRWDRVMSLFKRRDLDVLRAMGCRVRCDGGLWEIRVGGEGCAGDNLPRLVAEAAKMIRSDAFRSVRTAHEFFSYYRDDLLRAFPRLNLRCVTQNHFHRVVDEDSSKYCDWQTSENLAWQAANARIGNLLAETLGMTLRPKFAGVERRHCLFDNRELVASGITAIGALDAHFERVHGAGEFLNWRDKYLELEDARHRRGAAPSQLDEVLG